MKVTSLNIQTIIILAILFVVPIEMFAHKEWTIQYKLEGDTEYRLFDWDSWVALDKSNSNHETFSYNGNVGKISGLIDAVEIKMSGKYPYTRSQLGFNELFVMLTKPVTRYKDVSQQWVNDNVNEKLRKVDLSDVIGMDDNIEMMFFKCHVLEEVLFPNELVKSSFSSLNSSFWMCYKLQKADMTSFHNIASMQQTFAYCKDMKEVKFSNQQTCPEIMTMYCLFARCEKLETVDLSMFPKVKYSTDKSAPTIDRMFWYCDSLRYVKMPGDFMPQNNRHGIEDSSLDYEANFEGTNPNCLVYLSDFTPEHIEAWHNVACKNQNDAYEAITDFDIYRTSNECTYECPYPIEIKDHKLQIHLVLGNTSWQALYVPFSMNYDDWKDDFDVASISGVHQNNDDTNKTYVVFSMMKDGNRTEPNKPYFIRSKSVGEKTISLDNTVLEETKEKTYCIESGDVNFNFTGTYHTVSDMFSKEYYAMSDGALKKASSDAVSLLPFRWYLSVTDHDGNTVSLNAKTMNILPSDATTGLENVHGDNHKTASAIYTITGIYKGNDARILSPGFYIRNNRKFIVK